MRRDIEEIRIYAGSQTVREVFMEDVPMGSVNPANGHEILTKIIHRGRMLCKDYGALRDDDNRFDGMIAKKMIRRADEIRIYV